MKSKEFYLNNPNLKAANVKHNFTQHEIDEYIKCMEDPIYFIKNYCKIITLDNPEEVLFDLFPYQIDMIDMFEKESLSLSMLPRQSGKSILTAAYILWKSLFTRNYNTAILANKAPIATETLLRFKMMFELLPKFLQVGVVRWNEGDIKLENGSRVLAAATSVSAVRGKSLNCVVLDELAHVPRNMQDSFYTSVFPTLSSGKTTKLIVISTPNGMELFYKLWSDSKNGKNDFKTFQAHWWDNPNRDEVWKQKQLNAMTEDQFNQEFLCDFIGSSNTLINASKLKTLVSQNPIQKTQYMNVYETPREKAEYVITVDTGRGIGLDYSAFIVFDISSIPYKVVATYRNNKIQPMVYPQAIYNAAKSYNNASILVEVNDVGGQVSDILFNDFEYENIIFISVDGRSGQKVGGGFGARTQNGLKTSPATKRIGCANLKSLIEGDKLLTNDDNLNKELLQFVAKGNSYEADVGNDDLVMCCVMFAWLADQQYFKEITNNDVRAMIAEENEKSIMDSMISIFITDGREEQENDFYDNEVF